MNREDDTTIEFADEPASDGSPDRFPWEQQDNQPTISVLLRSSYQTKQRMTALAKSLHSDINTLEQIRARVRWQGHAWKWAVTYTHPRITRQSPAAFAYLIPAPERLQLVIPLDQDMLDHFREAGRLNNHEYLAEPIGKAIRPNEYAWPIWTITNKRQAYQLIRLAKWKLALLADHKR